VGPEGFPQRNRGGPQWRHTIRGKKEHRRGTELEGKQENPDGDGHTA